MRGKISIGPEKRPHKYQLVRWIVRGPKSFNIVPFTWLTNIQENRKNCLASFFPPGPFIGIDEFVKEYVQHEPSWEATKIHIVGGSGIFFFYFSFYK